VSSWGTGIEQMVIAFKIFSIDTDLTRVEAEINRKLLAHPYYAEFDRDALQAMDAKAISELYNSAIQYARRTPNEIRRRENLPDKPGGDVLYGNINMAPLESLPIGKAGSSPAPEKAPATPEKPPPAA